MNGERKKRLRYSELFLLKYFAYMLNSCTEKSSVRICLGEFEPASRSTIVFFIPLCRPLEQKQFKTRFRLNCSEKLKENSKVNVFLPNSFKNEQGGSVMCDCTQGSGTAHPKVWHNFLPNEEQIEKPTKFKYFSKKIWCMNEEIDSKANKSVEKKRCIRLIRYAIIKKASQDEQQNQTTTTTNINYIRKFMPALKMKT